MWKQLRGQMFILDAVNEATKLATEEAQEEAKEGMEDGTRIGRGFWACVKPRWFKQNLQLSRYNTPHFII